VFRAATVSVLLMIAVGPSAALLCKAWCNRAGVAVSDCQHGQANTTPALTGVEDCEAAALTAIVREEIRRGVSWSDSRAAVAVLPNHYTNSSRQVHTWDPPALRSPAGLRPLLTALRI
jgi:hypothetical protein